MNEDGLLPQKRERMRYHSIRVTSALRDALKEIAREKGVEESVVSREFLADGVRRYRRSHSAVPTRKAA